MKISCESCGANYAIADHKVRGRLVKVRCKSCSATILVDGRTLDEPKPADAGSADPPAAASAPAAAPAPAASPTPPPAAGPSGGLREATDDEDDATRIYTGGDRADAGSEDPNSWSVNLSDTDQRTMTTEEIIVGFVAGEVTDDAFVWREGMDDWQPVLDVAELRTAIEARQPPKSKPPEPAFDFSPPASTEPDQPSPAVAARVKEAPAAREDLFGDVESAGSEAEAMSVEIPAEPESEKKIGARNENSVLFSLDALKAGMPGGAPAGGEAGKKAPKAPAPGSLSYGAASSPVDDLLGLGGGGGSGALFSADANAALLTAPVPEPPKPKPKPKPVEAEDGEKPAVVVEKKMNPMVFVAIGGLMVVLVAGALVAGLMLGKGDQDEVAQKTDTTGAQPDQGKTDDKGGAADDKQHATAQPTTPSEESKRDGTSAAAAEAKPGEKKEITEEDRKRYEEAKKKAEEEKKKAAAEDTAASKTDKPADKKDAKKEEKEEKKEASGGGAPFNKSAAIAALSSAAAAASGCKRPGGPTGTGRVTVTFMPSGRATGANVSGGGFGGTSVGGCVASVFRRAKIPPFDGNPVTVSKSFTISP